MEGIVSRVFTIIFTVCILLVGDYLLAGERGLRPNETSPNYETHIQGELLSTTDFGEYRALIIGNKKYTYWPKLETPENDAIEIDRVLREKYGFKTKVLLNATRSDILRALNDFQKELTEKDNLLIYYAGHGYLDEKIGRGYWVPVDGELNSSVNWISTIDITDFLSRMSAKHVIVVADSCYSGALTRSSAARLEVGMSEEARRHWLNTMSQKRSRTVLSSGDLKPVLDTGVGGHSVFAKAFLDKLLENDKILEGEELYMQISAQVTYAADALMEEQVPRYASINRAGNESGDFLFIPKQSAVVSINAPEVKPPVTEVTIQDSKEPSEPSSDTQPPEVKSITVPKVEAPVAETPTQKPQIASVPEVTTIKTPRQAEVLRNEGFVYYQNKQYDRAIETLNRTIELEPKDHYAYYYRGLSYSGLRDYQRAISDFDRAMELEPKDHYAYYYRGLSYLELKDYQRAISDFDRAMELNPNYSPAYSSKGLAYYELKDYQNAVGSFTRALELDPKDLTTYFNRGLSYTYLKEYELAINDFNEVLKLDPTYRDAQTNRDILYKKINRLREKNRK